MCRLIYPQAGLSDSNRLSLEDRENMTLTS